MLANMSEIEPRAELPPLDWSDAPMNEPLPTGTVTLLLADVQGSTQLWDSQPSEMTAAIANLDQTLAELVDIHHGVPHPRVRQAGPRLARAIGPGSGSPVGQPISSRVPRSRIARQPRLSMASTMSSPRSVAAANANPSAEISGACNTPSR